MRWDRILLVTLSLAVLQSAGAQTDRDRALLTVQGKVAAVEQAQDTAGTRWTDVDLLPAGNAGPVRIRIAPSTLLDAESFRVAVGDSLQVRVFSDETPFGAQQVRNRGTGRTLRLRCLHGEAIWNESQARGEAGRGAGSGGQQGGPRHRGGR